MVRSPRKTFSHAANKATCARATHATVRPRASILKPNLLQVRMAALKCNIERLSFQAAHRLPACPAFSPRGYGGCLQPHHPPEDTHRPHTQTGECPLGKVMPVTTAFTLPFFLLLSCQEKMKGCSLPQTVRMSRTECQW